VLRRVRVSIYPPIEIKEVIMSIRIELCEIDVKKVVATVELTNGDVE